VRAEGRMSEASQEQVCPMPGFDGSAVLIGVRWEGSPGGGPERVRRGLGGARCSVGPSKQRRRFVRRDALAAWVGRRRDRSRSALGPSRRWRERGERSRAPVSVASVLW